MFGWLRIFVGMTVVFVILAQQARQAGAGALDWTACSDAVTDSDASAGDRLSPSLPDNAASLTLAPSTRYDEDIIVYTAHQGWLSRIYLLRTDGSVITFFEYEFYYLADLEVVNNEVYVAEAFAPRVLQVDLDTGDLDVVVDDWSLYYFYDLAFDGTYFYLNEWDLNRYDINGTKDGMASFDGPARGGAWDGAYYWTLNDEENVIKCWDISQWPTITEVPENAFAPPSPHCRGLWFDGQHFWTAESIEDTLGYIYQFDYDWSVIKQWLEPAFQGWSACVVRPSMPDPVPTLSQWGMIAMTVLLIPVGVAVFRRMKRCEA